MREDTKKAIAELNEQRVGPQARVILEMLDGLVTALERDVIRLSQEQARYILQNAELEAANAGHVTLLERTDRVIVRAQEELRSHEKMRRSYMQYIDRLRATLSNLYETEQLSDNAKRVINKVLETGAHANT